MSNFNRLCKQEFDKMYERLISQKKPKKMKNLKQEKKFTRTMIPKPNKTSNRNLQGKELKTIEQESIPIQRNPNNQEKQNKEIQMKKRNEEINQFKSKEQVKNVKKNSIYFRTLNTNKIEVYSKKMKDTIKQSSKCTFSYHEDHFISYKGLYRMHCLLKWKNQKKYRIRLNDIYHNLNNKEEEEDEENDDKRLYTMIMIYNPHYKHIIKRTRKKIHLLNTFQKRRHLKQLIQRLFYSKSTNPTTKCIYPSTPSNFNHKPQSYENFLMFSTAQYGDIGWNDHVPPPPRLLSPI